MNTHQTSNANQRKSGCCCAGKSSISSAAPDTNSVSRSSQPLHQLQVQGATCGGCVKSIEHTLKSVSGVSEASMDLATGVASVYGAADIGGAIDALKQTGYEAVLMTDSVS
nr:heavy metal-associated domain-containing protein [Thalassolituus sp.]